MKRFTLFAACLIAVLSSFTASAQTFTLDKDTNKAAWFSTGIVVEININATNSSSSNIAIDWKVTDYVLGPKWTFEGFCDNLLCRYESTPGLVDGSGATFSTAPFTGKANFRADFNGDAADNGTQSLIRVEMTSGGTTSYGTFIATKGSTGISTVFKKEETVSIFPNPAQNYIDVLYSPNSDVKTIAIYNLIGKAVNVYKVTNKNSARCEFPTDMPSGIYVVRIADSKGNIVATRKITRQ